MGATSKAILPMLTRLTPAFNRGILYLKGQGWILYFLLTTLLPFWDWAVHDQARYQFKMDRRVLSPIQLAAITRIYGEHGAEILELLRKNPCKTIPTILKRLRQKDLEWRVVSVDLFLLLAP